MQRQIPSYEAAFQSPLRPLEALDVEILLRDAGPWWLFYALLLVTGLPCAKVSQLFCGHCDHRRQGLVFPDGRSGRYLLYRLPYVILRRIPRDRPPGEPLFPSLNVEGIDHVLYEEELNSRLAEPLAYMQSLLAAAGFSITNWGSLLPGVPNVPTGAGTTCLANTECGAMMLKRESRSFIFWIYS